jgi:hypothetical protein
MARDQLIPRAFYANVTFFVKIPTNYFILTPALLCNGNRV